MSGRLTRYKLVLPTASESFSPPQDTGELWRLYLRDKAETTRENYARDLQCFARFLGKSSPMAALETLLSCDAPQANAMVVGYIGYLKEHRFYRDGDDPATAEPAQLGYAPNTIHRRVYALRGVADLARMCGFISWEIQVKLRKSEPARDTRGPGPEGYGRILEAIEAAVAEIRERYEAQEGKDRRLRRTLEIALRDLVLVRLLHDSGLRRAEATRIEWPLGVVLEDKPRVLVLGKGKTRTEWVAISTPCARATRRYLELRGQRRGYLLRGTHPSYRDQRMNLSTVNRRVKYWGQQAATATTPHGLRHTAATRVLDETAGDYRTASQWSRHKDPGSLRSYDDAQREDARRLTELVADPSGARSHDE